MSKLINYPIREMIYLDDAETRYFFTYNMLSSGVYIKYDTVLDANTDKFHSSIDVKVVSDDDAMTFEMWSGEFIEPIQAYRIIKDINGLFIDNLLPDFIDAMNLLSGSSTSASMQSNPFHHDEMYNAGHDEFIWLQNSIAEA